MATDFRTTFLNFDTTTGQVQEEKATVVFNQPVNRFVAALQGYDLSYAGGEDHHLGQLVVELFSDRTPGTNNAVDVTVRYLLRDASGNIDDPYQGAVGVHVIADVG
jgi:hypothetical protein